MLYGRKLQSGPKNPAIFGVIKNGVTPTEPRKKKHALLSMKNPGCLFGYGILIVFHGLWENPVLQLGKYSPYNWVFHPQAIPIP